MSFFQVVRFRLVCVFILEVVELDGFEMYGLLGCLSFVDVDKLFVCVEVMIDEIVDFLVCMICVLMVNFLGENYCECVDVFGGVMCDFDFDVDMIVVEDVVEYLDDYLCVNVIGFCDVGVGCLLVYFNGYFDVVLVGDGWMEDFFGGVVKDGKFYGCGSVDMKVGFVCVFFVVELL